MPMKEPSKRLRATTFAINFTVAALFSIACVVSVAAGESPYQFIAGLFLAVPFAVYALVEWLVFYREQHTLKRKLTIANVAFLVLLLLASIGGLMESLEQEEPFSLSFFLIGAAIWLIVIGYAALVVYIRWGWVRDGNKADVRIKLENV